jgi:hypothetical protein
VTTVPQQALFLMNSPFMKQQARSLAARPDVQSRGKIEERIQHLHRILFGRDAQPEEVDLAKEFLGNRNVGWAILPVRELAAGPPVENNTSNGEGDVFSPWEEYVQALLLANEFIFID